MRDLIILGGEVHCAEMAEIVERINRDRPTWNLRGLISPHKAQVGTQRNGYPVLGSPESIDAFPEAWFVSDHEWPHTGAPPLERMVSLIDPSVFVPRTARIGRGCVLYPNGFVGLNAVLGDRIFALSGCVINHDCVLEDGVTLATGVHLAGSVHVESGCYLGQSCTVRQEVRIGRGSLIGMGAVVVRDVPPGTVLVGNPGRRLRGRD